MNMKRLLAISLVVVALRVDAQTVTTAHVTYNPTSGVLKAPANFLSANDIAKQSNLTNLWSNTITRLDALEAVDDWQNEAISNSDSIASIAHAGQLTSYSAPNIWTITQTWDFTTGSNGTDWTYANGAFWVTNFGVKLNGPPFGYVSTNQRVTWAQAQTAYAYRVTFVSKSGGWNPNGQIFIPSGVEYSFAVDQSNAVMTNVVIITNITQIGVAHGNIYYSPNFVQSVTIESATAPTNKVTFGGDFVPDVGGTWDIGSPSNPVQDVHAMRGPWWKWEFFAPTSSTHAASNHTIAVDRTNLFVCFTNSWRGAGTNWGRAALQDF